MIDPRALLIREVAYCRSDQDIPAEERVARRTWDVAGRAVADWDPRLWAAGSRANNTVIPSLSGHTLLADSVDAGWTLSLTGADKQIQENRDGRGHFSLTECDALLRPVSITEKAPDAEATVVERLTYGGAAAPSGQRGRLIRHDDPAGTSQALAFGVTGGVLIANRRFLQDTQISPDWPLESASRDQLLEAGEGHTTTTLFDAMAMPISQIDAAGNRQVHRYNVDGSLKETAIELVGSSTAQTLVSDIQYNPFGQVISERLGNGVRTENTYELQTGRLIGISARTAEGIVLQNLTYEHDPVSNIVRLEDLSAAPSAARNTKADPANLYRYDSLYQLVEATGREVKTGFSHGPALPDEQPLLPDPTQLTNYTQTYSYDAGANLRQMRHVGDHSFTRTMLVASDSNRSLPEGEVDNPLERGFDANGNLQELVRGQPLLWDARNQLRQVTAVQRADGAHDDEVYVYDGYGQRCRKLRRAQTNARTLNAEVRYLPGLEIRNEPDGERLNVASVQAGRSRVRILHWEAGKPNGIDNDQVRYTLQDHLGSSALELDHQGELISQEGYYPFGGTAWWAARSAVQAKYKTVRYSGKERDASGLYDYGFRYYAPWLMRWINPDPDRNADGPNLYRMVRNNPLSLTDHDGRAPTPLDPVADDGHNTQPKLTAPPQKSQETFSYVVEDLERTLATTEEGAEERNRLINENFTHKIVLKSMIKTDPKLSTLEKPSKYWNRFEKHEWTFMHNFKYSDSGKIFANDVARHQYKAVAKANHFFGHLPSTIRRFKVINETTLSKTEGLENESAEMLEVFFSQTPNGKTTQRILDDFDLKATAVRREPNAGKIDFVISVEPKGSFTRVSAAESDTTAASTSSRPTTGFFRRRLQKTKAVA
ncbi:RHS repeat-associated core domain-containing protein [Pseudomonas abietaniphila]|uniref:RHS repeat-associated core domain-containing protein n=1 Tax=Pseudomonas abietaniphila TaxID=89065 RepID=UPI003217C29D